MACSLRIVSEVVTRSFTGFFFVNLRMRSWVDAAA